MKKIDWKHAGNLFNEFLFSVVMIMMLIVPSVTLTNIYFFGNMPFWDINLDPISVRNLADLANVGNYVGGLAGPVLNFFTVMLLVFSVNFQQRQLTISKKELEATRAEMALAREEAKRAADANEELVKEQRLQTERAIQSANALSEAAVAQIASAEAQKRLAQANIISLKIQAFETEKVRLEKSIKNNDNIQYNRKRVVFLQNEINDLHKELDDMKYNKNLYL